MKKITEYIIIYGETSGELMQHVNVFIEDKWQPIGGIAVAKTLLLDAHETGEEKTTFMQSMVRYEE